MAGKHRRTVIVLWMVIILSVCFGVYKNFTAIGVHTVHEEEVIKEQLLDTNCIENFVADFARVYYSWENNETSLNNRTNAISSYLTVELQHLNLDMVQQDIPTVASVKDVKVWDVSKSREDNEYSVTYSVTQEITEGETVSEVVFYYDVMVYVDDDKSMVITKNPTLSSVPVKSAYSPKAVENNDSVDVNTISDATEFLNTFFKLYPTASKEELVYYVKDEVLKPITGDYVFLELVNPVFIKDGKDIVCNVTVKYSDNRTKSTQISQYALKLHKGDNWMIVGVD